MVDIVLNGFVKTEKSSILYDLGYPNIHLKVANIHPVGGYNL